MLRKLALLLLILSGSVFAQTELEGELAKCVNFAGDLERLNCFEEVLRKRGLMPTQEVKPSENSNWVKQIEVNPLDDTKTVTLILPADSGESRFGKEIVLVLRCQSNRTNAYINWRDFIGSDDQRVTTRVGDAPAQTSTWSISTSNDATFVPGSDIEFIKQLMASNKFVAQTTPYNESPVTAVFDTTGLSSEIAELRQTCNW